MPAASRLDELIVAALRDNATREHDPRCPSDHQPEAACTCGRKRAAEALTVLTEIQELDRLVRNRRVGQGQERRRHDRRAPHWIEDLMISPCETSHR